MSLYTPPPGGGAGAPTAPVHFFSTGAFASVNPAPFVIPVDLSLYVRIDVMLVGAVSNSNVNFDNWFAAAGVQQGTKGTNGISATIRQTFLWSFSFPVTDSGNGGGYKWNDDNSANSSVIRSGFALTTGTPIDELRFMPQGTSDVNGLAAHAWGWPR